MSNSYVVVFDYNIISIYHTVTGALEFYFNIAVFSSGLARQSYCRNAILFVVCPSVSRP